MKEVKTPKKPLAIYYTVVLLVLLLLNLVLVPWMSERQVKEVDYGTFMSMTEDKNIGRVDIESNQIAAAVDQQSSASEEISQSIVSIRGSSDEHVTNGLHSQRSASGVAQLADGMLELVQQFWARRRA